MSCHGSLTGDASDSAVAVAVAHESADAVCVLTAHFGSTAHTMQTALADSRTVRVLLAPLLPAASANGRMRLRLRARGMRPPHPKHERDPLVEVGADLVSCNMAAHLLIDATLSKAAAHIVGASGSVFTRINGVAFGAAAGDQLYIDVYL